MKKCVDRVRWLGLSVLWSGLWLAILLLLTMDVRTPRLHAAPLPAVTQSSTISFSETTYVVSEGVGSANIVLLVSPPSSTSVTVTVSSASIQAEPLLDFEGLRSSLVISPSVSTYTLSLTIVDDMWVEGDEQLRLTLGTLEGVLPGAITETIVTIADNDVAYLGISDVTVEEEAESVTLVITQSVTSTLQSLVDVRTVDGSATSPADFSSLFTTAVITPGSQTATVTIPLHGDSEVEGVEYFLVQLEDAAHAQLANMLPTMTATVTLLDDDVLPEIEVAPATANESARVLPFVATLSATWPQTVTVDYATRDGSAIAPDDYLITTGVFTIPPGTLSTTVLVPIHEDQANEPDENLLLILSNPVQAILSRDEVEGVIQDGNSDSRLYLPTLAR